MRLPRVLVGALAALLTAAAVPAARAATHAPVRPAFAPPAPARIARQSPISRGPVFSTQLLHFIVHVGPDRATTCDIVGELFQPDSATSTAPVPVILTTNGFGGSYQDQISLAKYFAARGYDVLTYSGLGFGGSSCNIELDDPDWDGQAASQLISFLGTRPEVVKDGPDDPRVGMVGGSYGGAIQFATASVDPRLDAIVPVITWNDLAYSLSPNNDTSTFVHTDIEAGVEKFQWSSLFTVLGLSEPASHNTLVPALATGCPGFDPKVCQAFATSAALGYTDRSTINELRHASMVSYYQRVHVPVMLMQGEGDTLFNLNDAIANYNALRSVGNQVKLVIQSWGHSQGTPAPGEVSYTSTTTGYETLLIQDWFDKYLKHANVSTGPTVEYFRDWVTYNHNGSAEPAYATASSWPIGQVLHLYLSGNGALVSRPADVASGSQSFVNPPGGATGSYSETSALQGMAPLSGIAPTDVAGTFASWRTAPLTAAVDSVGIPVVRFRLSSTSPAGLDPLSDPVVFGKLYDVAPDGSVTLVERLVSPIRVADETQAITLTLPGVVHRYGAGHRVELVLAATDMAYEGGRVPGLLTVTVDRGHPTSLDLPVIASTNENTGGARATGA
jgi:ABC-2 type transport system ATP-binding protein